MTHQAIQVRWRQSVRPVYDHIYARISQPLVMRDGVVVLDGADLVRFDLDGNVLWRCCHDYGFWGRPMQWGEERLACATLENSVEIIDQMGCIQQTIELPSSVSTEMLCSNSSIWFGIGSSECSVIKLDNGGNVVFERFIDVNDGIRHKFTEKRNNIWISANSGLFCLDGELGEIIAHTSGIICNSSPYVVNDGLLVVARTPDFEQAVVHVDDQGAIVNQHPLPLLYRAHLRKCGDGAIWLVGSSVSPWDAPTATDTVIIGRLNARGEPEQLIETQPDRAIEVSVDQQDVLWIGSWTSEVEQGRLMAYTPQLEPWLDWEEAAQSGWSAPAFGRDRGGPHYVATPTAIVCFSLV